MRFAVNSRAPLARPEAFRWMRRENGGVRFGQICVKIVESNCNFMEGGHIRGYWNAEMALRVEFRTVLWKMTVLRPDRFLRKRNGVGRL